MDQSLSNKLSQITNKSSLIKKLESNSIVSYVKIVSCVLGIETIRFKYINNDMYIVNGTTHISVICSPINGSIVYEIDNVVYTNEFISKKVINNGITFCVILTPNILVNIVSHIPQTYNVIDSMIHNVDKITSDEVLVKCDTSHAYVKLNKLKLKLLTNQQLDDSITISCSNDKTLTVLWSILNKSICVLLEVTNIEELVDIYWLCDQLNMTDIQDIIISIMIKTIKANYNNGMKLTIHQISLIEERINNIFVKYIAKSISNTHFIIDHSI